MMTGREAVENSRGLGLDFAESRGDGDAAKWLVVGVGVGGHKGLLGFAIGLEIATLSIAECERLRDRPFLFIESVSLVKLKARVFLVRGVLGKLPRGGVFSPMGTRSSTSLLERFSALIVSSLSMIGTS